MTCYTLETRMIPLPFLNLTGKKDAILSNIIVSSRDARRAVLQQIPLGWQDIAHRTIGGVKKMKSCAFALVYANLWKPRLERSAKCLLKPLKTLWVKINQEIASASQLGYMKFQQLKPEVRNLHPAFEGSGKFKLETRWCPSLKRRAVFFFFWGKVC